MQDGWQLEKGLIFLELKSSKGISVAFPRSNIDGQVNTLLISSGRLRSA